MKRLISTLIAATLLLFSQTAFSQHPWAGAGTAQDPFRIYTIEDLEKITEYQFDDEYRFDTVMYSSIRHISYRYCHFALMNDIEEPLTQNLCYNFEGYLHGKGHTITLGFNNEVHEHVNYLNTFIGGLYGSVDSLTFIGNCYSLYSLFGHIETAGKISYLTCNLNIIPTAMGIDCNIVHIFSDENNGLIEYCVNNSNLNNTATTEVVFTVFSWANSGRIEHCINNGNINVDNVAFRVWVFIFACGEGGTITNSINHGDITIIGEPVWVTLVSCFAFFSSNISHCMNTGNLNVKGTPVDIIGVFVGELRYNDTVSNCLNTGRVSGNEVASGIVGKMWTGIIENCFNAGYIDGDNHVGGIVGSFNDNFSGCIIRNNLDISKTSKYALVGQEVAQASHYPYYLIMENNFYDKQMVTVPATPEGDVAGKAEGKLTTELTGFALQSVLGSGWSYAEGRYPIPLGLEHHPAALLAATPVYLHYENTAHFNTVDSVNHDFTIGLENGVQWQTTHNKVLLSGENGYLQNIGSEILTCSLDNYTKDILLEIKSINPITTYTISGTVTCDNNRLAGVRISYSTTYTTTDIDGNYSLTIPAGSNVTITPSLDSYAFIPADTTITNIAQNIDNVNFTATTSGIAPNSLNDIKIYPNPATDELYIISGETINSVEIVDVSGRAVFLPSFGGVGGGIINVSHLSAGFYFVKIHTDKGVAVRKIVKQ